MTDRLKDKVAIITGAGSGMGKAIAEKYVSEGAKVVLTDINKENLVIVEKEILKVGGEVVISQGDVTSQKDIDTAMNLAIDTYGHLDILVNNAGIMDNFTTVGNVTDEAYEKIMAVNLTGAFKAARAAINIMEKQDNGGVIVNNASVGGLFGSLGGAVYVMSKHGLVGLTKNIAATYGRFGKVRANAIAPGGVNTNIQSTITEPDPLGMKAIQTYAQPPVGESDQIAELALFLGSDESSFLNGDVIKADGGMTV